MLKESMLFVTNLHFKKDGNGGQQRTYFLIKELSNHFDLHVLSPYTNDNNLGIEANFILNKSVHIKKKFVKNRLVFQGFKILNKLLAKYESESALHQSNLETYILKKQLRDISLDSKYKNLDTIVFDTLAVVQKVDGLFKNRILNAHNFDSELAQMSLDNKLKEPKVNEQDINNANKSLSLLKRYEHNIAKYFSEIWVCSLADEIKFKEANLNTKVRFFVLPNGSDTELRTFQPVKNNYKQILFVGTLNYFPNFKGLQWFVKTIFSHLPKDYQLNIVGKSPNLEDFEFVKSYKNINLIGEVEDIEEVYRNHDVVVVPLLEGSGTRLKILEAMSYGKLVLSTAKGIEGINAEHKRDYLEFNNKADFDVVLKELNNPDLLLSIRQNGRLLIEERYSWKGIVNTYFQDLNKV